MDGEINLNPLAPENEHLWLKAVEEVLGERVKEPPPEIQPPEPP